jgi:hypothetical protein
VADLPPDLRPVAKEGWGLWARRNLAAVRRGLFQPEDFVSSHDRFGPGARFRKSVEARKKANVRDGLVRLSTSDSDYAVYRQLPEDARQAVFETVAPPRLQIAVDQGQGRNTIVLREMFRSR